MPEDPFEFNLNAKVTRVSEQDMLASLRKFAAHRGGSPFTTRDYDDWEGRVCSSWTISERLGSWRLALARIGIGTGVRSRRYSPRELMDNLELVWRELGRPPGQPSMTQHGYRISSGPYRMRWGSLRQACSALARFKRGEITERQLLGGASPRPARAALPLRLRWDILARDGGRCVKCGGGPPDVELEVDHIVPVARGGGSEVENLQTLCRPCNQGKKDR